MLNKVTLWLEKFIYTIFAFLILIIMILNILNSSSFDTLSFQAPKYFNTYTIILSITLILFLFLLRKLLTRTLRNINTKKIVIPLLLTSIVLQILVLKYLNINPSWDFGILVDESKHLLQTGKLVSYFEFYPNNVFAVCLMAFLGKIFSPNLLVYQVINLILITISQYMIYLLGTKVGSKEIGLYGFILGIFFFPYIFYSPIVYTDTISLPFLLVPMLILAMKKNHSFRYNVILLILSSVIMSFGVLLKGSMIVFMIALSITLFIHMKNWKKSLAILPILLFFVVKTLFNSWIFDSNILDKNNVDKYRFPITHWFLMGQNDQSHGMFNDTDFRYTLNNIQEKPREELIKFHVTESKKRIKSRGLMGNVSFISKKLTSTWADGTYFSLNKLSRNPIIPSNFQALTDGKSGILLLGYARIQHLLLLGGVLFFSFFHWKTERRNNDFFTFAMISLIGFFFFFLLWETRSRYIVSLTPVLIILSSIGYLQPIKEKRD
ncbi:ArnT family glycosyltransferase [Neobacillus vireti]|uniref:ArnT family glycosyltransferase n=1 Tax=Neobacillus vireti TaxID=220686 RepID=UPI0030002D67